MRGEHFSSSGDFVGKVLSAPFLMIRDWFQFLNNLPERQRELTIASHGAVMMVLAGVGVYLLRKNEFPVPHEIDKDWVYYAFGALGIWGGVWFFRGASRSRGYREASLIMRAAMKIALGALAYLFRHKMPVYPLIGPFEPALMLGLSYWCLITGPVKLALLLRGPPAKPDGDDINKPWPGGFDRNSGLIPPAG